MVECRMTNARKDKLWRSGYDGQNGERGVYIRWANITAAPSIFLQDRQHYITSSPDRDIASYAGNQALTVSHYCDILN